MADIGDIIEDAKNGKLNFGKTFVFGSDMIHGGNGTGKLTLHFSTYKSYKQINYDVEMLTDLYIPWQGKLKDVGKTSVRDPNTGVTKEVDIYVTYKAVVEYQSDSNFHIVELHRESSNTDQKFPFEYYNEGIMYLTGKGFPQDRNKAIELFKQGAALDHPLSKRKLLELETGISIASAPQQTAEASALSSQGFAASQAGDYAKAVEIWLKTAAMGNVIDMNNLAYCYRNGKGVPKDMTKAAEWYEKAANLGDAKAMNSLGYCYLNGNGKPKDQAKAVAWFRIAIDAGNVSAICSLGECYRDGTGVTQDFAKAEELINESIAKSDPNQRASKEAELAKLKEMRESGITAPAPQPAPQSSSSTGFAVGDIVFAEWSTDDFYLAKITQLQSNGRADVEYYDGNKSSNVRIGYFKNMVQTHYAAGNPYLDKKGSCEILETTDTEVKVRFQESGSVETLPIKSIIFTTPKPQAQPAAPAPAPQSSGDSIFCTNCGTKLPGDARFCNNCGTPTQGK